MADRDKQAVISAVDAIGRCKQCGSPVTQFNKVMGPTGMFCSDECKSRHESFTAQAGSLERKTGGTLFGLPRFLGKTVGRLIVLAIVLVGIGIAGTVFEIPVISPLVANIRSSIGI